MPADETPVHKTPVHEVERILAGRYRLQAVIGRGGMGAVWRARDELLNRNVAIKEIVWPDLLDPAERETARRRAVREAQMAARLSHPNVVGVYDILEEDGRPCIVMELVPVPGQQCPGEQRIERAPSRVLPLHQRDRFLDRRPTRLADLA
jgi:hypothetical protein